MLLYPLDLLRASGVARTMNFVSNAVALAVFIVGGHVAWVLGIGMGLALMTAPTSAHARPSAAARASSGRCSSSWYWR